jgi:hypothetical protein
MNSEKLDVSVDGIHLAPNRDQWRSLVDMVMDLSDSVKIVKMMGISRVAEQLLASQEGLRS